MPELASNATVSSACRMAPSWAKSSQAASMRSSATCTSTVARPSFRQRSSLNLVLNPTPSGLKAWSFRKAIAHGTTLWHSHADDHARTAGDVGHLLAVRGIHRLATPRDLQDGHAQHPPAQGANTADHRWTDAGDPDHFRFPGHRRLAQPLDTKRRHRNARAGRLSLIHISEPTRRTPISY